MIADKLILPVYRYHRNKKRAAQWVFCHFYHPSGSLPQHMLCEPDGPYFIKPPEKHLEFFPKGKDGSVPRYCLIGTEVIGHDDEGNPIERPVRLTQRDMWPYGAKPTEQVIVETAHFVIGRQEALDPYRDFMSINTETAQLIMREERSMEAINAQQNRELENWQNIETGVLRLVKMIPVQLILSFAAAGGGIGAVIIGIMANK